MSGLEILGGIASAVQLATSCHQLQKRVRMRSGDKALSATIDAECGILINEINKHILTLSVDSRQAVQHLLDRLTTIKSRIEQRKTRKAIIKGISVLRLYGSSDKDDLLVALQEYQSRAALIGSVALNNVLLQTSRGGMTPELERSLVSITNALTTLGYNMSQTENQIGKISIAIEEVEGKIDASLNQLSEISCDVKRSNDAFYNHKTTLQNAMKEELVLFRESLPVRGLLNPLGCVDRGNLEMDLGTMKGYLESIVQGGGWPSDLEIWECIWDVVETVHLWAPFVAGSMGSLEEVGTVGVDVSGDSHVVYFSPMTHILWDSLDLYRRYPKIQGTRRFKWTLQVLNPTLTQAKSMKAPSQGIGWSNNELSEICLQEPLPIFHALLMILVNPRWIPRDLGAPSDFNFERTLQSAFTEKDNPYLASVCYHNEGSESFNALDRLNHLWYLMFSGFTPDDSCLGERFETARDIPVRGFETDTVSSDLVTLSGCHAASIIPVESQSQKLFFESILDDPNSTTVTVDTPEVVPRKTAYQKRLEVSRDRFLDNLPNPNRINCRSKGQNLPEIVLIIRTTSRFLRY